MTRMNDFNLVICIGIFQCRTDLFASDIKFVTIVLVKVAGQGAERALGGRVREVVIFVNIYQIGKR